MTDIKTREQRSHNMAAIKGKDTKPEMIVWKYLFSRGLRYRVNDRKLSGSPDIVLKNIRGLFLLMGVFGMDIRTVSSQSLKRYFGAIT